MGIQKWSDNILLVDLPQEPEIAEELEAVVDIVREENKYDVVIDFTSVDIVTSSSLSRLLKLREPIVYNEKRLILCNIATAIKGVLTITGLDGVFELADDKFNALATLEMIG